MNQSKLKKKKGNGEKSLVAVGGGKWERQGGSSYLRWRPLSGRWIANIPLISGRQVAKKDSMKTCQLSHFGAKYETFFKFLMR